MRRKETGCLLAGFLAIGLISWLLLAMAHPWAPAQFLGDREPDAGFPTEDGVSVYYVKGDFDDVRDMADRALAQHAIGIHRYKTYYEADGDSWSVTISKGRWKFVNPYRGPGESTNDLREPHITTVVVEDTRPVSEPESFWDRIKRWLHL